MNPYDLISSGSPSYSACRPGGKASMAVLTSGLLCIALFSCRRDEPSADTAKTQASAKGSIRGELQKPERPPTLAELKVATREAIGTSFSEKNGSFALHQLCDRARAADLAALLDSLDPEDRANNAVIAAIFSSLGRKDPALFLKYASDLDPTSFVLRQNFLAPLLETDSKAVVDWMAHAPHETAASRSLFNELCTCLTTSDPGALLSLLGDVADPWQRMKLQRAAFQAWGQQDFRSALAYAQGSSTGDDLEMNLVDLVRGAAAGHPQEALDFLRAQSPAFPPKLCDVFFTAWFAEKDHAQAISAMADLPQASLQQLLLTHPDQAGEFAALSPAQAQQTLSGLPLDGTSLPTFKAVALAMLDHDAATAVAWGSSLPTTGEEKNQLITSLYSRWSGLDPEASRTALLQLTDPSLRGAALKGLASALVANDPASAIAYGRSLPAELQADYVADALGWLLNSPPGTITAAHLVSDPELNREIVSSQVFQEKLTATGASLATKTVDAARDWLSTLSEDRRPAAAEGVASSWLKSDASSAIDWIQSMPNGETRDAAVRALVRELESTDPQSAREWQREIGKR